MKLNNTVFVVNINNKPLMPTNYKKARKLLKRNQAEIFRHDPFTIRLTKQTTNYIQPIEACIDSGYQNIGLSIKSEKDEFVHNEYVNLLVESNNIKSKSEKRRTRRNKLRYRRCKFPKLKNEEDKKENKEGVKLVNQRGRIAPSLKNRADNHVRVIEKYYKLVPITTIYVETGKFDTQLMEQINETGEIISGSQYQEGHKLNFKHIDDYVRCRDDFRCCVCKKPGTKDNPLVTHHIVPRSKGGSDKANNLISVHKNCHTAAAHEPGGALYNLKAKTKSLKQSAFMNTVQYYLLDTIKDVASNAEVKRTFGNYTNRSRKALGMVKTHANDAFSMGNFHPKHKVKTCRYKKRRRNDRSLTSFYDSKYVDIRDGEVKTGSQLSCGRTKRNVKRNNENNLRIYRGQKIQKGKETNTRQRYCVQAHDVIKYQGKIWKCEGIHGCIGKKSATLIDENGNKKSVSIKKFNSIPNAPRVIKKIGGWIEVK